jgi:hypothetical protein
LIVTAATREWINGVVDQYFRSIKHLFNNVVSSYDLGLGSNKSQVFGYYMALHAMQGVRVFVSMSDSPADHGYFWDACLSSMLNATCHSLRLITFPTLQDLQDQLVHAANIIASVEERESHSIYHFYRERSSVEYILQ